MTAPVVAPTPTPVSDDDLFHIVCDCDDNRSLCGLDVSLSAWSSGYGLLHCVVCDELDGLMCERCGAE